MAKTAVRESVEIVEDVRSAFERIASREGLKLSVHMSQICVFDPRRLIECVHPGFLGFLGGSTHKLAKKIGDFYDDDGLNEFIVERSYKTTAIDLANKLAKEMRIKVRVVVCEDSDAKEICWHNGD